MNTMTTATFDRVGTIEKILKAAAKPMPPTRELFELMGTDGADPIFPPSRRGSVRPTQEADSFG